jgi:hypothetical protein
VSTADRNQYPDPEGPAEYPTLREEPAEAEFPTLHEPDESLGSTEFAGSAAGAEFIGPAEPAGRPRGTTNRIDPVSVGAGLVFFLIGGAYLLASGGHLTVNAGWTFSLLLLGLGLSGVIGAILGRSRRGR